MNPESHDIMEPTDRTAEPQNEHDQHLRPELLLDLQNSIDVSKLETPLANQTNLRFDDN